MKLLLEFTVALIDQSFEGLGARLDEIRFGSRSRPAKIALYLLPGNVIFRFGQGNGKRRNILSLFEGFEHFVILAGTH